MYMVMVKQEKYYGHWRRASLGIPNEFSTEKEAIRVVEILLNRNHWEDEACIQVIDDNGNICAQWG